MPMHRSILAHHCKLFGIPRTEVAAEGGSLTHWDRSRSNRTLNCSTSASNSLCKLRLSFGFIGRRGVMGEFRRRSVFPTSLRAA